MSKAFLLFASKYYLPLLIIAGLVAYLSSWEWGLLAAMVEAQLLKLEVMADLADARGQRLSKVTSTVLGELNDKPD